MSEDIGKRREDLAKLLFARICCLIGLLTSAGGIVLGIVGVSVSAGAVAVVHGVLGDFLGTRRLRAATIVLGVVAIFFMAAVSTGLIPGITPPGHGYG